MVGQLGSCLRITQRVKSTGTIQGQYRRSDFVRAMYRPLESYSFSQLSHLQGYFSWHSASRCRSNLDFFVSAHHKPVQPLSETWSKLYVSSTWSDYYIFVCLDITDQYRPRMGLGIRQKALRVLRTRNPQWGKAFPREWLTLCGNILFQIIQLPWCRSSCREITNNASRRGSVDERPE